MIFNGQISFTVQPVCNGTDYWFGNSSNTTEFPWIVDIQEVLVRRQWFSLIRCLIIQTQGEVHLIRGVPNRSLIYSRSWLEQLCISA